MINVTECMVVKFVRTQSLQRKKVLVKMNFTTLNSDLCAFAPFKERFPFLTKKTKKVTITSSTCIAYVKLNVQYCLLISKWIWIWKLQRYDYNYEMELNKMLWITHCSCYVNKKTNVLTWLFVALSHTHKQCNKWQQHTQKSLSFTFSLTLLEMHDILAVLHWQGSIFWSANW